MGHRGSGWLGPDYLVIGGGVEVHLLRYDFVVVVEDRPKVRRAERLGRPGADVEIITWLDDHSRYALHVSAHVRITGPIVAASFRETAAQHGYPASTLTDNGMVYTTRFAGGRGGRTSLEHELRRLDIVQKNSRPNHPTTCRKAERFQQTMKKWLPTQPDQPTTIAQLQALLDVFTQEYNQRRPHRSLPHNATPAAAYLARPKASPRASRAGDPQPSPTRPPGRLRLRHPARRRPPPHRHRGRTHARTHVILLVQDLHIRIVNAATGELLRELTLDPTRDYQPTGAPKGPTRNPQK